MPRTVLKGFRELDGSVPILEWLRAVDRKASAKLIARLRRLEELGSELRRPEADYLRDGIYELRVGHRGVNYRILYFFAGKDIVVVSHGLTKEREVPPREIDHAIIRKKAFGKNAERHTATFWPLQISASDH